MPESLAPPPWLAALLAEDAELYHWAQRAWTVAAAIAGNWYDAPLAEAIVELWPRYFRHTEGRWAGKPFNLAPWQAAIVRLLVGWKNAEGFRHFRRLVLWVGKKNGKSEFLAALAILFWAFDGEMGGQAYAFAANEKQARIVFEKAKTMIGLSPVLAQKITRYKKSLWLPELWAKFELLSGNAAGKHGMSASVGVGDEIHEWIDDALLTTVHQSTAARDQPIELLGSTSGFRNRGYGWTLWEECVAILEGRLDQPETLVVIFALAQEADWTDEKNWPRANPNIGISPKIEYLRAECAKAKENPRLENDFRRYHCNQWTEQAVRWIPLKRWDQNCGAIDWRALAATVAGRSCFGALDLSSVRDVTAWLKLFPPLADGEPWIVVPRFFVPKDAMAERVKRDRVSYDVWVRAGALEVTEGNVVDQDRIKTAVQDDAGRFDIREIGYDPWNAVKLALELQNDGAAMVQMRQGIPTLGAPSKSFETLLWSNRYAHGGHPVLRWMAGNVAVQTDSNGNFKPDKAKSTEKIDGIVAQIMAQGLADNDNDGPAESVYEQIARERREKAEQAA